MVRCLLVFLAALPCLAQVDEGEMRLLVAQLRSADADVRDAATERLMLLSPQCYPYISGALESRDADVRMRARVIMSGLHERIEATLLEIIALNGKDSGRGKEMWDWLISLGEAGVTPLFAVTSELLRNSTYPDEDPVTRLAMMALKEMIGPEDHERLFAILDQPDHPMYASTARLLGDLRFVEAVPVLIKSLKEGANNLQAAAAWALGWIREHPDILPALHEAYEAETDAEVRHAIACAVSRFGDTRYMEDAIAFSKSLVEGANPPTAYNLNRLGCDYLFVEDWDNAIATFERMLAMNPDSSTAHYNICCAYSLQGKTEEALEAFKNAVRHGFVDVQHIEADRDLDNLRTLDGFIEVVVKLKAGRGTAAAD